MQQKTLVKAIATAVAGVAISMGAVGSASAHVMYNTANWGSTDGWVLTGGAGGGGTPIPWLGTPGGALPFGFSPQKHALNWAATLHDAGDTLEVSAANAAADYNGAVVDLDTANGAWGSWQVDPANPTFTRGWAHNTDFGLIKSLVDTTIRVEVSKVNPADNIFNYGITVFEGIHSGEINHHSIWNAGYISGVNENPAKVSNPFGGTGLTYLTHGDSSFVEFFAHANQVYSLQLGGNDVGGDIFGTPYGYKVNISSVPVPAAVWLFGSALLGLVGINRRKTTDLAGL